MGSNIEEFRNSLTPQQREHIDYLKSQVINAINERSEPIITDEMVYDITDFDKIWNDDDFKDLSFKKELVITAAVSTLLIASLIGLKMLSSR